MKVKPTCNFELLGTSIALDKGKTYIAVVASNQSNWETEEKIFVEGVLLSKGDYEVISAG